MNIKKIMNVIGSLIALLGIVYIAFKLYDYGVVNIFSRYTLVDFLVLFLLTLICVATNYILAVAWFFIIRQFKGQITLYAAIKIYALSQIGKYVPGNIFQYASRQALGMASGIPGWSLVKSSLWELGLIFLAGCSFSLLLLPQFIGILSEYISIVCFLMSFVFFSILTWRILGDNITHAFALYMFFLLVTGFVFTILILLQPEFTLPNYQYLFILCGAYVISWLIGLITPGAPAGVGVRELVLFFLLKELVSEDILLSVVLLGRIITIGGDVLFYIILAASKVKIGEGNV